MTHSSASLQAAAPERPAATAKLESPLPQSGEVLIPRARFVMGDVWNRGFRQERPTRQVELAPYWLAARCVNAEQYLEFIRGAGEAFDELWCDFINPCFILRTATGYRLCEGGASYPMVQVSFVGAVAYCNYRSLRAGLAPVYDLKTLDADLSHGGYRLPTEAEWEYACGGPAQHEYGHGPQFDPSRVAWSGLTGPAAELRASHRGIGGFGLYDHAPVPVGSLPPNDFGLYEMLGNVNEWCQDRYAAYSADTGQCDRNPSGPDTGSFRVIRGGSFIHGPETARKSYRHGIHFQSKCMIDGFRVARNAGPKERD